MQRHSRFRPYVFCMFALLLVGSPLLRAHTTTVGPRAAAEATHSLPFKLHGTATLAFTPVLDSNGQPTGKLLGHSLAPESGTATYLGHWTADVPDFVLTPITGEAGVFMASHPVTYHAANGDLLFAVVSGTVNFNNGQVHAMVTWTGGSGRFAGAQGTDSEEGQISNPATGTLMFSIMGSISL